MYITNTDYELVLWPKTIWLYDECHAWRQSDLRCRLSPTRHSVMTKWLQNLSDKPRNVKLNWEKESLCSTYVTIQGIKKLNWPKTDMTNISKVTCTWQWLWIKSCDQRMTTLLQNKCDIWMTIWSLCWLSPTRHKIMAI
jgi:hypothetical protein